MNTPHSNTTQTPSSISMGVKSSLVCAPSNRARKSDPETSHKAARFATSQKAAAERLSIYLAICNKGPMTAREVAAETGLDYIEVQRRISEVLGLRKTTDSRDGCRVWGLAP